MTSYIAYLASQADAGRIALSTRLDESLAELDKEMESLCAALEVEYVGPGVGMADMGAEHVYRLVVRRHTWDVFKEAWGLKVCDALDNCEYRPMWPVQGVARLRKQQILRALPAFFAGFLEAVEAAGKADTPAGARIREMAGAFSG